MKTTYLFLQYTLTILLFTQCAPPQNNNSDNRQQGLLADSGMVVSAHPVASEIGKLILQQGGNAVDASVAVGFALAVCYPTAGNLGGGGFMVVRTADGETATLDFREMAPSGSSRTMFLNDSGEVKGKESLETHLGAGVPGSVAGMVEAHACYGTMAWDELVQPAIDIARNGFAVTAQQAAQLNDLKSIFEARNSGTVAFVKDSLWQEGDILIQSDLAQTLEKIRDYGRDGFYTGETAQQIVTEMQRGNGIVTLSDLADYKAVWREPITGSYRGYKIISMPPPSSGGIALMQLLKMVEPYDIHSWGKWDTRTLHLMIEAERRVFADRSKYLGDNDFFDVPIANLLNTDYLKTRMADFDPVKASRSSDILPGEIAGYESEETTHYSIVDSQRNAVSITTTINNSYGSRIVVQGAGFLLNNEMDDFSVKPGYPNLYGLVGGEANAIEARKRMLSSMTPAIIEKDSSLYMVVGSPGGSTIITSVFQSVINIIDFDMTMQEAVTAPRFHHQWLPEEVFVEEKGFSDSLKNSLQNKGHLFTTRPTIGRVDAILVYPDSTLEGGADPRGDDAARGY